VTGNFVGTNPQGTVAEPNGIDGIRIESSNHNTIGGTTPEARNVASGNTIDGIHVVGTLVAPATNNLIEGNFAGVNAAGTGSVGNLLNGIVLRSDGNLTAPLGPGQPNEPGVQNNLIGGTATGAGNLVGFNGTGGVAVFGNPVSLSGQANTGNAILGNNIFENG